MLARRSRRLCQVNGRYRSRFAQGGNGEPTETGRKGYEAAQRLKEAHPNLPLRDVSYGVLDKMADSWCRRPGGPVAFAG